MVNKLYFLAFCSTLATVVLCGVSKRFPTRYDSLVSRCEPIRISMCKGLPYNTTHFPNLLGHETQVEAEREINQFRPLVSVNCSQEIRSFLCSLYAPVCISMSGSLQMLKPCRHKCKQARKGCNRLLKKFGFHWPKAFRCKRFPKKKNNTLCIDWGKKDKSSKSKGNKKQKKKRKSKSRKTSTGKRKSDRNRKKDKRNGKKGRKNGKKNKRG